jgi:von Willebrand factor type A domain
MHIVFLTPLAALVALTILVPVSAAVVRERRDGRIRCALGLATPSRAARLASAIAATLLLACLSAAAAQPAVLVARPLPARTDAQVFFVVDVSRSMSAAASAHSPDRFERATALALRLRRHLGTVPAGVASMSDRVLPHLYPTADRRVFASVLHRSIAIGRPAAGGLAAPRSTDLQSLEQLRTGYFGPVRHRLAIVLTDGESNPFETHGLVAALRGGRIHVLLLRVWSSHESIYGPDHKRDPRYRPDPRSTAQLGALRPYLVGGRVFDEHSAGAAEAAAKRYFGRGPEVTQGRSERTLRLGQYAALAAALPLLFLLWRNRS